MRRCHHGPSSQVTVWLPSQPLPCKNNVNYDNWFTLWTLGPTRYIKSSKSNFRHRISAGSPASLQWFSQSGQTNWFLHFLIIKFCESLECLGPPKAGRTTFCRRAKLHRAALSSLKPSPLREHLLMKEFPVIRKPTLLWYVANYCCFEIAKSMMEKFHSMTENQH